jgi:hypothetical protein
MQGFHFARPMNVADMTTWLQAHDAMGSIAPTGGTASAA